MPRASMDLADLAIAAAGARRRANEAESRLEAHVAKAIVDAPPLSDEQRRRIARLLAGGGSDAA